MWTTFLFVLIITIVNCQNGNQVSLLNGQHKPQPFFFERKWSLGPILVITAAPTRRVGNFGGPGGDYYPLNTNANNPNYNNPFLNNQFPIRPQNNFNFNQPGPNRWGSIYDMLYFNSYAN